MKKTIVLLALSFGSVGAWASCYTVLGPRGEILSESHNPPVDMSYPLHVTVPKRFGPGAVMVFGIADGDCGTRVDAYTALTPVQYQRISASQQAPRMRPPRRDRQ